MKKMLKIGAIALVAIVVSLLVSPYLTKNKANMTAYTIDLLNPFVGTEEVYGIVPADPSSSWEDAGNGGKDYAYHVKTYNQSGKERKVQVVAFGSKMGKEIKILKIKAKGQSVRGYEAVAATDVPKDILNKLEGE